MTQPASILFLAADPSDSGRSRLDQEYREVKEALKLARHRDAFRLENEWAVKPKSMRNALLEHHPMILHLAGQSNEVGILLEGRAGKAQAVPPDVLAGLLELFQGELEWVVLSGCLEENQASAISEVIPNVIGLAGSLSPDQRIEAAVSIYDAIGAGKTGAGFIAKLAQLSGRMAGGTADQVQLFQAGKRVDMSKADDAATQKDRSQEPLRSEYVSHQTAFECDRTPQHDRFREVWEREEQPFFFFLLHGDDPQSHHGLIRRFHQLYLLEEDEPRLTPRYKLVLDHLLSEQAYQDAIRSQLFAEMRQVKLLKLPDEQEMAALYKKLSRKQVESVAVEIRVRSSHWKEFTPRLFDWFVNQYCRLKNEAAFGPTFYFFLSIIYDRSADHQILVDRIREELPQLKGCTILEELEPVSTSDIMTWIDQHLSSNPIRQQQLWKRYFPEDRTTYDMAEVELRLDKMVDKEPKG
ncbi:MAG: hypothetical protein AAF399_01530 [Bacteroidota bacterium]